MSVRITSMWRHPIKAHGREEVNETQLIPGQCMPGDRVWAVAHENTKTDGGEWARCQNFTRGAGHPQLMAITAQTEGAYITLSHPKRQDLRFRPNQDQAAFLEWVRPLMEPERAQPVKIIHANGLGLTDSSWPSITLCNAASHRVIEEHLGQDLSIHRWRGNVWLDGLEPWEEFNWIDRELRLGDAILRIRQRTERCIATEANPATGQRDVKTLNALDAWGHRDFSVKAEVVKGGLVRTEDTLELL
ncbi:MOSC domain-containing protein [Epibacterium ulvae]|uniref:MOSC domain-containing protein n=1 Tax=Epibacterium ulvae TaxID=1156985 RepID=UPI002490E072|nr:MOSC N-terminal beta barrel domain-containing protein [Epibacterium ulvae]